MDGQKMLIDQLLTGPNVAFAGSIMVIVSMLRSYFKEFWKTAAGQRLLPMLPLVLGQAGAFVGMTDAHTWQDKVVIGLIAGYAAAHSFKVGKTSVMGYGLEEQDETEAVPAEKKPEQAVAAEQQPTEKKE